MDQRVKRNKMFAAPAASIASTTDYIQVRSTYRAIACLFSAPDVAISMLSGCTSQLSRIESLLGVTGVRRVIGMLGQDERKRFFLEDLTTRIYIDLSNAVRLVCAISKAWHS